MNLIYSNYFNYWEINCNQINNKKVNKKKFKVFFFCNPLKKSKQTKPNQHEKPKIDKNATVSTNEKLLTFVDFIWLSNKKKTNQNK